MPTPDPRYFAAVDLGSNSFHMLIARENNDSIEVIDRVKEMVQIARGLQADGTLSDEVQQRALNCLACFGERIRDIPSSRVRAVGTKTLRSAANSTPFLSAAELALGHPIQTISGYEEARLVYSGVAHSIDDDRCKRLVIDIGGGSTEFIIGHHYSPLLLESLSIGCVTYAERYLLNGGVTRENLHKAYLATCEELELIRAEYLHEGWDITFGASGTMRVIAELMPHESGAAVITKNNLDKLIEHTIINGEVIAEGISKLRKDVLPAGLAILKGIFDHLNIDELHVADATLKEGLIYDSLGRLSQHDSRDQTVNTLLERYNIDKKQAERVKKTALRFWSQLNLPPTPRVAMDKLVNWSATLHEIGLSISHASYHHHGHYLLKHSDLAGFSRYEQHLLAKLVNFHRRKLHASTRESFEHHGYSLCIALICLRLAVLLNRSREDLNEFPDIQIEASQIILKFTPQWLKQHPLTVGSLTKEVDHLEQIGFRLEFQQ